MEAYGSFEKYAFDTACVMLCEEPEMSAENLIVVRVLPGR
jgi:hypothetical protein